MFLEQSNKKIIFSCFFLLSTLLTLVSSNIHAQVLAELQSAQNPQKRTPIEPIVLRFSNPITSETLPTLVLELDAVNITAMAQVTAEGIQYEPVQALSFGNHELRLVSYGADGSITEIGYWTLDIRQSAFFQQVSLVTQTDITATQIVDEKNLDTEDKFSAQGTFVAQSQMLNESLQVDTYADFFGFDDKALSPTQKAVDLNNYYLIAQSNGYRFGMGTQAYATADLLSDGLQKRGISAGKTFNTLNTSLNVFSYAAQNLVGFEEFSGVGQNDNRISGTTFSAVPVNKDGAQIVTSVSHYYGRNGGTVFNDTFSLQQMINEGTGTNVVIDSNFFSRKLRLRLEGAQTEYDFDGRAFGFDAVKDDAYSALLAYTAAPNPASTSPFLWMVGLEAVSVGTFYKSIANPNLPGDLSMQRLFTQMSKGQYVMDISYATEENNLDGITALPTVESTEWFINNNYNFPLLSEHASWFRSLFGTPSLMLTFTGSDSQDDSIAVTTASNDWEAEGVNLQASFRYNTWSWTVAHAKNAFEDFNDLQIDTEVENTQLNLQFNINQRFNVNGGWQWQQTLNQDYGTVSDAKILSFGASGVLVKDRLSAMVSFNQSQNEALNDPFFAQDAEQNYWSASLSWTALQAKNKRPGLDVSLSVTTQEYNDYLTVANSRDTMQAFLSIRTVLPTSNSGVAQ